MASVQAAVSAGLGVSIVPRSLLLPGCKCCLTAGTILILGGWAWGCCAGRAGTERYRGRAGTGDTPDVECAGGESSGGLSAERCDPAEGATAC
jgi:hypothetical protein